MGPRMMTAHAWAGLAAIGLAVFASPPVSGADTRWPADEALRAGMAVIRKATLDNHTLVTHRRMPPADARRFADTVANAVTRIRTESEIAPPARKEIEAILGDIASG